MKYKTGQIITFMDKHGHIEGGKIIDLNDTHALVEVRRPRGISGFQTYTVKESVAFDKIQLIKKP